jgi:serine phosphatase RsbU (regulator of sigma subunit)
LVYKVALVFTLTVGLFIRANEAWVVPRVVKKGEEGRGVALRRTGSYATAGMVGTLVGAILVDHFIVHGVFGSGRSILILAIFSILFSALFIGIGSAQHYYGVYFERVREEERFKARVEHEIRTAAAIQQALLPGERPVSARFEAAGASLPSRTIAGDFLDYFEVPGDRLAFVLGDVSGKGPPAAILAAAIQGMFSSVAESDESPAEALRRINGALVRRAVESRFATVFHGLLAPDGRMVTCNAGHNPPLLLRHDGTTQWITTGGLLVGVFEQAQFEEESFALAPGDALVLFSDGVTEAQSASGEMYGEDRLLALLKGATAKSATEIVNHVLDDVRVFSDGAAQADDITVLVVRYKGSPPEGLPPSPASV